MGDGWDTEEAGAEDTSLKAGEAVMETRTRVLTVEIEVSQGFCEPHDSVLIIFVFGAWNHLLGNFCLSFQSHLQQPPPEKPSFTISDGICISMAFYQTVLGVPIGCGPHEQQIGKRASFWIHGW